MAVELEFEFDKNKSIANKQKHGISFVEAQLLWSNKEALIVPANTTNNEPRYAIISVLNSKCFAAIFAMRKQKYRIISVRRCRKNEEKNYANQC